ncbi:hypothetical protein ACOZ38_43755 [Sphaerisporangium viridialbum]|uniref:hypothetical protein n=1 Tax=Sphaerisporangium viridialbum TaxID=46189 RepID=UPI003C7870A4
MPVTLAELRVKYGRHWLVSDAVGGGWYAVRRHGISRELLQRGLCNVRCAATLDGLAARMAAETQLEDRLLRGSEASGRLPECPEPFPPGT